MYKKFIYLVIILSISFSVYSYNDEISEVSRIINNLGCQPKYLNEEIYAKFICPHGFHVKEKTYTILCGKKAYIDIINILKHSPYKENMINIVMQYIRYIIESKEFENFYYNSYQYGNNPIPVNLFIKQQLQYFLEETENIDFNAELYAVYYGQVYKYFKNQEYQRKSTIWKAGYRAGNEIVLPARFFVKDWLYDYNGKYAVNNYIYKNIAIINVNEYHGNCGHHDLYFSNGSNITITSENSNRNIKLWFEYHPYKKFGEKNSSRYYNFNSILEYKIKQKLNKMYYYLKNSININNLQLITKLEEETKAKLKKSIKEECSDCYLGDFDLKYTIMYKEKSNKLIEQNKIKTKIRFNKSNNLETKPGCPVLLEAKLERYKGFNRDISDEHIHFEININGYWQEIEDDGISMTSLITDKSADKGLGSGGVASVYYVPHDDVDPGRYKIKAVYEGSNIYEKTEIIRWLTIQPSITQKLMKRNSITKIKHTVGRGIPLILVHGNRGDKKIGYGHWKTFINYVNRHRSKFSKFDIYVWKHDTDLPIGFNGSTGNAKELAIYLKQYILPKYPSGTKAIFVAYSRGGLVCRSFMNYKNQGDDILGLITLGTPHHGSPGAVADWSAIIWKDSGNKITEKASKIIFEKFVCTDNKGPFDWDRMGDLNLAWDNMDGAFDTKVLSHRYNVKFSNDKKIYLSKQDLNTYYYNWNDLTNIYSSQYKIMFGILDMLNINEKYFHKIITYAAYDNDLSDNAWKYIHNIRNNHKNLEVAIKLLAYASGSNGGKIVYNNSVYYANDGLVPIQSALFLDISNGMPFCYSEGWSINLIKNNIIDRMRVKAFRIFSGGDFTSANTDGQGLNVHFTKGSENDYIINDHLDLIDTPIRNERYWGRLAEDINDFTY